MPLDSTRASFRSLCGANIRGTAPPTACCRFLRVRLNSRPSEPAQASVAPAGFCVEVLDSDDDAAAAVQDAFVCECGASFATKRLLREHCARMHGAAAPLTDACFRTRCERCGLEYWSWDRLRGHLRKSHQCFATYSESDIGGQRPSGKRHSADPSGAWRPVMRTEDRDHFGPL